MIFRLKTFRTLCGVGLVACLATVARAEDPPGASHGSKVTQSAVAARVDGQEIRVEEIDARIGNEAFELEKKLYTLRKQAMDDMVTNILLAREAEKRGQSVQELLASIATSAAPPDPAEVDREFAENRELLTRLGEAVGRYRVFLEVQANQRSETLRRFIEDLRTKAGVQTFLAEPRRELHLAASKCTLGDKKAPLQLVVFLDYDCPFCKQLESGLLSMVQPHSGRSPVGISVKQLPLPIHKTARRAALAAVCAGSQGKFEQFHDRLLTSSDHTDQAIVELAMESGLDPAALSQCMASEEAARMVDADVAEARMLGADATPSVFVDGARLDFSDINDLLRQISTRAKQYDKNEKNVSTGGAQ